MKIYVVNYNWDYEESDTIGTYSTLEGAKKSIEEYIKHDCEESENKLDYYKVEFKEEDNSYHVYELDKEGNIERWFGTFYIEETFLNN